MLHGEGEHSAILLIFIQLPFVIKTIVLAFFEWLFYTGFTIVIYMYRLTVFILMDNPIHSMEMSILYFKELPVKFSIK